MRQPAVEMNVFEAILARRSVRSYTPQPVDGKTVGLLLEAAVRAPTAMHEEPWAFAVIQNAGLLQRISDRAKPLFITDMRRSGAEVPAQFLKMTSDPGFNIFHGAGTLIVICANSLGPMVAADCWLAAENMMLAACAMGLGSCVIGMALPALNLATTKAELGIKEQFSAIAPIIVGHPEGETRQASRKEPLILSSIAAS